MAKAKKLYDYSTKELIAIGIASFGTFLTGYVVKAKLNKDFKSRNTI